MLALPPQPVRGMDLPPGNPYFELPYHGFVPRQYAVPAQAELEVRSGARNSHPSYSDRVRRRKTPHGPVFDDYDITPTDRTVHMPANKHVLVSPSTTGPNYSHRRSATDSWPNPRAENSSYAQVQRNVSMSSVTSQHLPQASAQASTWDFPGGLDSVLNNGTISSTAQASLPFCRPRFKVKLGQLLPQDLGYMVPTGRMAASVLIDLHRLEMIVSTSLTIDHTMYLALWPTVPTCHRATRTLHINTTNISIAPSLKRHTISITMVLPLNSVTYQTAITLLIMSRSPNSCLSIV